MTDSIRNENAGADGRLGERIRAAYGEMEPGEEAVARMRAAVLDAAARSAGDGPNQDGQAAAGPYGEAEAPAAPARPAGGTDGAGRAQAAPGTTAAADTPARPAPRKRRSPVAWALPLAACLVAGAIAVGVANTADPADVSQQVAVSQSTSDDASRNAPANSPQAASRLYAGDGFMAEDADEMAVQGMLPVPMDDFNTEEYAALDETGFVSTKANPLSTVSADVDTASYCNLRRMLNDGQGAGGIPAGAVRIEEMLNYFRYDYATPVGSDLFATTVRAGDCPWNDKTKLLVMGFATAPEDAAASKGSNLVFLIDVSGSMDSPDKLDLLQDSFATLLEGLGGDDRVSIVTYSGQEEVVLEGARGDDEKEILRAIYRLDADGSTNGEAGLKMAYEVAERNRIEGGVNRIIMASDGDLNVGMTSESDLHDFVDSKRDSGIYLSVLGFGSSNYKDTKMETLADHGNGQYHYIDCIEEAARVFGANLTANLVPLADDVKVQVEFNPAQVKAYRLIGYENRALADEDFTNDAKDAGDVGPGSQFTVAYEVVLADSDFPVNEPDLKYGAEAAGDPSNPEWLTCSMRYKPTGQAESTAQQIAVGPASLANDPGDDWRFAAAVIEFGMALRGSEFAGSSDLQAARELALASHPDEERQGLVELIDKAIERDVAE